jgi:hypothetical protein
MTPEQFAVWLDGFLAGAGASLSAEQLTVVQTKLAGVRALPPVVVPMQFFPVPYVPPAPAKPYIPSPWINPSVGPIWIGTPLDRPFEITCNNPVSLYGQPSDVNWNVPGIASS